jgi:peptidoglycan/LPS O-acetylase OafA/YrhL
MTYRCEIDGLRALAIIPVVLFHAGIAGFSGGFVGVDVFFVLSGYLITGILIRSAEDGTFAILDFYERRARRILPALFAVMLACTPFAWRWMEIVDFRNFGESLAAVSLFASNFLFWSESDYFGGDADQKPLLHTWSLAVEEQYYIVFPILLILIWRYRQGALPYVLAALALISLGIAEWGWRHAPTANFYLFPSRAWEILTGSLCAWAQWRGGTRRHGGLAWVGIAMIMAAVFVFDETTPFPSLLALLPVIGTALVVRYGTQGTGAARMLSTRGFVWVGLISYSTYLVHQPLLAFTRIFSLSEPSTALMAGMAALSFPLGWLSWRYVERPFRRRGRGAIWPGTRFLAVSAAGLACFVAAGAAVHLKLQAISPLIITDTLIDKAEARTASWGALVTNPRLAEELARFPARAVDGTINVLVTGDSHAKDVLNALELHKDLFPSFAFRQAGINGYCYDKVAALGPAPIDVPACVRDFLEEFADKTRDADWILLSVRWSARLYFVDHMAEMIAALQAAGYKVAVSGGAPEFYDSAKFMRRIMAGGPVGKDKIDARFTASLDQRVVDLNARIRGIAEGAGAVYLDKLAFSCAGDPLLCDAVTEDLRPLRYDDCHWTLAGATRFAEEMARIDWLAPLRGASAAAPG